MDNIALTSSTETSLHTGNPLNPLPIPPLASEPATTSTIESIISTPLEPVLDVEQSNVDGNVQAHLDVNYQAHDVALASVKTNSPQQMKGFKATEHQKIDIDDHDEHPDKSQPCCSMLNKLFLALAIVCFALFLCSIAYIIANLEGLNGKYDQRSFLRNRNIYSINDELNTYESTESHFNLTHPNQDGIIVVLSRRGASITDILLPSIDQNGTRNYRSIVLQGGNENHFGAVRFGFHDSVNSMNMINQLPANYRFLDYHTEEWSMNVNNNKPYHVRFVRDLVQIIYEFSLTDPNEFRMTTMVATPSDTDIIADPTNNIYFNLRSRGNLSTHYLNLSLSNTINIKNDQKSEQNRLMHSQQVDKLTNVNDYFYKLDRAGIGKNYIATLFESDTKTTMHVFADHAGVVVDPFGMKISNGNAAHVTAIPDLHGVRISPRQSPSYESSTIYGSTLLVYPSQAIHTTWWQLNYQN